MIFKNLVLLALFATFSAHSSTAVAAGTFPPVPPATRLQYIQKAQVWAPKSISSLDLLQGPSGKGAFRFDEAITCEYIYLHKAQQGGTTPKFRCRLLSDTLKVRYDEDNGEVYASVAATRLFWALGFLTDRNYPVRVTCIHCSEEPWVHRKPIRGSNFFDPAVVERKFEGAEIDLLGVKDSGWSWRELDQVSEAAGGASRAQVDALKLLAAFVQHGDSGAWQQRLVCPKDAIRGSDCLRPQLVIHDLGSTFGASARLITERSKMHYQSWASVPVWRDAGRCIAGLSGAKDGTLHDPVISEAGRKFLADLMSQLTDDQIRDLFVASKADRRKLSRTAISDWVRLFKAKRAQIVNHRCR